MRIFTLALFAAGSFALAATASAQQNVKVSAEASVPSCAIPIS